MKSNILFLLVTCLLLSRCNPVLNGELIDWCDQGLRADLLDLKEIKTKSEWFKVYDVGDRVYAISEPYNYEEVISYLILGEDHALLFDTGMGLDSISTIVQELTTLPVTVINSHTHYDHIGGNYEFDNILAMDTEYTIHWATNGWSHDLVRDEVSPDATCLRRLPHLDPDRYHVKPFSISKFVKDGHLIDLGNRTIEVITVPGHTPDAIALLDRGNGYLWTGDTFYEAPIWLFFDGTDLDAYKESIAKLATLVSSLTKVFPAHNTPIAQPIRLTELVEAFDMVVGGQVQPSVSDPNGLPVYDEQEKVVYDFEHFSFLIRADHLKRKGVLD